MSLKPDFGPNNDMLPPLPVILNPATRLQVFTHRSYFARRTHIFEDRQDDPSPDNERLEHLGDTVLNLAVTELILQMFPGLRVGPSTKTRALMVGNATLADISVRYRLPSKLRLHPAQAITLRASMNVQADVFEVKAWVNNLFPPYAMAAYNHTRVEHGLRALPTPERFRPHRTMLVSESFLNPWSIPSEGVFTDTRLCEAENTEGEVAEDTPVIGHLALFNQHLQRQDRSVEWVYSDGDVFGLGHALQELNVNTIVPELTPTTSKPTKPIVRGTKTTPVWSVRVLVDGEEYGSGKGNTKKAARNEAAKEGLIRLGVKF